MNMTQVWTLVRQALLFFGGILVGKGYLDAATMEAVVGAIITIATAIVGLWLRSPTQIVETAAALPQVHKIVAPDLAHQTKAMNVTSG